jgi:hypothetical protein
MPAKRPPCVSLGEWFEERLEPGDLLERNRTRFQEVKVVGSFWEESDGLVRLPNPARDRFRALVPKWREACAGGLKVWARRGAADAAVTEVTLSPTDWQRVWPYPTHNTMVLPRGTVGPDGRPIDIKWFDVQMEKDLIDAIKRFRAAHPEATYLQTEQAIRKETGASQREVRAALGNVPPLRKPGKPKKPST